MKHSKLLYPLSLLILITQAHADGGSGSNSSATCSGVVACPAGQTGEISFTYRLAYYDRINCPSITSEVQSRLRSGQTDEDVRYYLHKQTGYYGENITISRGCVESGPTYQSTNTETQNLNCPLTHPSGIWTQSRTYQLWSDGSHRDVSNWSDLTNTCTIIPVGREAETQSLTCPASLPNGIWTQTRTFDLWSDGTKTNFTPWSDTANTCAAALQSMQSEYRIVSCAIGEIGSVREKQTYEAWTDGSMRNYSGWVEVSSTCKPVPTQTTETKDGVQEETCDSYNGTTQGTYSGTVYKYGTYTTTYSDTAKITDTKFEITSIDFTSCVAQITDIMQEVDEVACPVGQIGTIQRYRVKAQNSLGQASYPYGAEWMVSNNNCASTQADTQPAANADAIPDGLLSNISVTSSSLQNGEEFSKYLNSLSATNWATSERHKLIVNVDDLSSGKYSASKIGSAISKFQSVVGAGNSYIEIALPKTIDRYVGHGGITAKAVEEKTVILKGVSFDGGNATLRYVELGNKIIEKPQPKEIVINVIPKSLGLNGVFSN